MLFAEAGAREGRAADSIMNEDREAMNMEILTTADTAILSEAV